MKHIKQIWLTLLLAMVGVGASAYEWDNYNFKAENADGIVLKYSFLDMASQVEVMGMEYAEEGSYSELGEEYFAGEGWGELVIPSSVSYDGKEYAVTKIGNGAFMECKITGISIPNSVTEIGNQAFSSCRLLRKVDLPNSVTAIGGMVFDGCWLEEPVYNDHLFAYLPTWYYSYDVPEGITTIADGAFSCCHSLCSVTLPNTVTELGGMLFFQCGALERVVIPNGVTEIKGWTFAYSGVQEVVLPDNLMFIDDYAFYDCSSLTSVQNISSNLFFIGQCAFEGCTSLVTPLYNENSFLYMPRFLEGEYTIPDGITYIAEKAFADCTLTTVNIPSSVTYIAPYAFSDSHLVTMRLPENITWIGDRAFCGCTDLKSFDFPGNINNIPYRTFENCTGLTSIKLPRNLAWIDDGAFIGCENLQQLYSPSLTPPETNVSGLWYKESCFDDAVKQNCILYVPEEAIDAYKTAHEWKEFLHIEAGYFPNEATFYAGTSIPETLTLSTQEMREFPLGSNMFLFVDTKDPLNLPANIITKNDADMWTAKEIRLTDGVPFYCPEDVLAETVTYTRTFDSAEWQSMFVPFELQESDWIGKADMAYINNVHQYDENNDGQPDRTVLEFFTVADGKVLANEPYIVKPNSTGEQTFTATNTILKATPATDACVDCSSTKCLYTISGTYQPKTDMLAKQAYAIEDGGFLLASSEEDVLAPFRLYLTVTARRGAEPYLVRPQRIDLMVDGEIIVNGNNETAVSAPKLTEPTSAPCYNLQGQRIARPTRGLFIQDGKKVVR